ncbi:MAG TPA: ABC transporter ATP-binding protein [Clostridiaceae bacterium]|nr:ABC transporter ATP-binding protein [Clostridiaceae bacterium]
MLKVKNLNTGYGNVQVLYDFSCEVKSGEVVSMVGSNGSGKSTLLKAISGIVKPFSGEIEFLGERIDKLPPHKIVALGIAHVPEGRQVFGKLSVAENLMMGAFIVKDEAQKKDRLQEMFDLFPILAERSKQAAETLSGGEQQMLAIARGLMSNPKLLLIDELSLGLAPVLVERVLEAINMIRKQVTILLVEQKVQEALEIADRGYVIQNGKLVITGTGAELLESDIVKQAYMGM